MPPISFSSFSSSFFLITGEGAGEGKCSQDQSRSLPDNHFQVRAAGGPAQGVGGCRDISLGIPKLDSPIRMMGGGVSGKGPREYLSFTTCSWVYPLVFGRYFSERGDAVAKASKETHVVSR